MKVEINQLIFKKNYSRNDQEVFNSTIIIILHIIQKVVNILH